MTILKIENHSQRLNQSAYSTQTCHPLSIQLLLIHRRLKSGGRVFIFMLYDSPFGARISYSKFRKKTSDLYREFGTIFTPIRFIRSIITAGHDFRLSCLTPR